MSSFYADVLRNSKAFRSDAVCKDMALLEPGTRAAVQALLDDAKHRGHDLRLLETYRSQTRQSALFMRHATQLRTVGCHGYGVAADFGVFTNGKYEEETSRTSFCANWHGSTDLFPVRIGGIRRRAASLTADMYSGFRCGVKTPFLRVPVPAGNL